YLAAGIGSPSMYTRIPSGFNVEAFRNPPDPAPLRARLGLQPGDFVIGNISRITRLKGHSDLLRAFKTVHASVPNARLLLVGSGSLQAQTEMEARELGLADRVIFAGLVPPAEVPAYVSVMDCIAHLSYREALSRALPQA